MALNAPSTLEERWELNVQPGERIIINSYVFSLYVLMKMMLTHARPGGGAWGAPSDASEVVPGNTARRPNVFEPRGSVHAFTAMAEAAQ